MADGGGWIDVSVPIRSGMLHWPGDAEVVVEKTATHAAGDHSEVTHLSLSAHTGTHMDAPLHFLPGADPIGAFPPELGIGSVRVLEIEASGSAIGPEHLGPAELAGVERLLLKTRNSSQLGYDQPFRDDYVRLTSEAAERVAAAGVRLIGTDYLSIGAPGEDGERAHRALLGAGVWIVEGLALRDVAPGWYEMACLPLPVPDADGAPARVLLRKRTSRDA
jgi:arylformamidase